VSFEINPGSHQVLLNVAEAGGVINLILAGARIHQSGCLGCIGMGQARNRAVSRTFPLLSVEAAPREIKSLCSPETVAPHLSKITDQESWATTPRFQTRGASSAESPFA
jgi:aconitate hydratase